MVTRIAELHLSSLYFPAESKPALHDLDLIINQGDFIVITGPPASGKSLLLHCLTGAVPHYFPAQLKGEVIVKGCTDLQRLAERVGLLGYMMQEPQSQIIYEDVYEDVAFGPGNLCLAKSEIDARVHESLRLAGIEDLIKDNAKELSGGQAQRVVLAGVLALGAEFLLLDQPTAELDPAGRKAVYEALGKLNRERNQTICVVMDRSREVLQYANRVLLMDKGTIAGEFSPQQYLLIKNKHSIEHKTNCPKQYGEIIAEFIDVSYSYKNGNVGCEALNFSLRKQEFVTLIGNNGSGKTTLARLFDGLLMPSKGSIILFQQLMNKKNQSEVRRKIGFLFQNPDYQIFCDTCSEEIAFSLRLAGFSEEEIVLRITKALEIVGLTDSREVHPQRLSRGQRQLLALACIFAGDYSLIIADEPTSGLDEEQGALIMQHLQELNQQGKTVLFITHDLSLVADYAQRIMVMNKRQLVCDFAREDLADYAKQLQELQIDLTRQKG